MRIQAVVVTALAAASVLAFGVGGAAASTSVHCTDTAADHATLQAAIDAGGTVTVYGTCLGTYTVTQHDVTIQAGTSGATIDAGGSSAGAVIAVLHPFGGSAHTLTLQGMTITGGREGGIDVGCSVCAQGNALNLIDSTVTGNSQSNAGSGGGITADYYAAITVSDSTISDNSAYSGGGIALEEESSLDMSGSIVTSNSATQVGGGISEASDGPFTVSNSQITENSSGTYGGGILEVFGSGDIENTKISWNRSGTFGGGVVGECAQLTLTGSTVDHNRAATDGGGISNGTPSDSHNTCIGDGDVELDQSTVSANTASRNGGGVANFGNCGTTSLTATGSAFGGNLATSGRGGAIYNTNGGCGDSTAQVSLSHTTVGRLPNTINPDRAKYGAGIFNAPGDGSSSVDLQSGANVGGNQASVDGGGVFDCPGGTLTVEPGASVSQNTPDNVVNGSTCP